MSGRPRHARKEIRAFADELARDGWHHQTTDADGHTVWAHPQATGTYKLPETPRHFELQRARRDVARLLGRKVPGKRNGKPKQPGGPRRDFVLEQATRRAPSTPPPRQRQQQPAPQRPVPPGPAVPVPRARRRLPWEDQPDNYDRGIAQMMRQIPGGHR